MVLLYESQRTRPRQSQPLNQRSENKQGEETVRRGQKMAAKAWRGCLEPDDAAFFSLVQSDQAV